MSSATKRTPTPAFFYDLPAKTAQFVDATPVTIDPELTENGRKETRFQARFFRVPWGGDLRTVHIKGPKVEIINLFYFPDPDQALPVYAIEFVVFGARPVVGVIDLKAVIDFEPLPKQCADILDEAHARFPELKTAADPPEWYQECRSGHDFFTRPESLDGLGCLIGCHRYVWEQFCALAGAGGRLPPELREQHAQAVQMYKAHHRINSPGLPFLNRQFGAEWTDRFLREGLFA